MTTTAEQAQSPASLKHDRKLATILGAAARIFAEEGYEKASIRRMAGELKMSLAGLYHYFSGKEELLFLIQHQAFDSLVSRLRRDLAGEPDPRKKLLAAARNHLVYFTEHMAELKVCSHELETLSGDNYRRVERLRKEYFDLVHGVVKELKESHGGTVSDTRVATLYLFGMLNWIYRWYSPSPRQSSALLAETLVTLFLDGFLPRPAGRGAGAGAP
jgi:AcrR family transcriptional regulator